MIGGLLADESDTARQGVPYITSIPVLGNLFSDKSHTGQKTNLLVFLTPHVIRDRDDARELSLDEREKFIGALGKKEMHDMPMTQVRELYKPNFSVSVAPGAEIGVPPAGPVGAGGVSDPDSSGRPSDYAPAPLNTREIGPNTKREGSAPATASMLAAAPAGASPSAASAKAAAVVAPVSDGATANVAGTTVKTTLTKDGGVLDAVSGLFGVRN